MSENHIENPVNISYTSTYSVCEAAQDTVLSFSDKYVESAESFIAKRLYKEENYTGVWL